jgi:hypothetical protein
MVTWIGLARRVDQHRQTRECFWETDIKEYLRVFLKPGGFIF